MGDARILLVTYCSRDKDPAPGEVPAVRRYLSPRVRAADGAARQLGWDFAILSGLHGLLEPDRPLAWYDHLLTADQVEDHAARCAGQLPEWGVAGVVLVSRSEEVDPGVGPYRECLERACAKAGIPFRVVEIGRQTPPAPDLATLLDPG
jgi:hypothetical protein